jgi:hypothetical protein
VTAVEPSLEMIRKRSAASARAIQAFAEDLPFDDGTFDASMAVLTVHHWADKAAGLREMRRVTRGRIILLTFDPSWRPWLTDYLPELAALDEKQMPAISDYRQWLGPVQIESVMVPHDCCDGFLYAYWRRPEAYLDKRIRTGSSSFWALGNADQGLAHLKSDLESGEWQRRYPELLNLERLRRGIPACRVGMSVVEDEITRIGKGSFLGPEDTMAGPEYDRNAFWPDVLITSEKEINEWFDRFEIISFTEHKQSGVTVNGARHNWHIFSVVARKIDL